MDVCLAQISVEEMREMDKQWAELGPDAKVPLADEGITEVSAPFHSPNRLPCDIDVAQTGHALALM